MSCHSYRWIRLHRSWYCSEGAGMVELGIGPKWPKKLARFIIRPQITTEQNINKIHHVRPHHTPCSRPPQRTNDGFMDRWLSICSTAIDVAALVSGYNCRNSLWNMGMENCRRLTYLTHHGRYRIIMNVLVQWLHPLVLYNDCMGPFCVMVKFKNQ